MNLLSGAEIWCPLSVLERLNPYYRGFFKEKIYENFTARFHCIWVIQ